MQTFIVLSVLLGLALANNQITYEGKIVNGHSAVITDFPYQVSLLYKMGPMCGGAIIRANVVLTAAHCVHGFDHGLFKIHYGDTNVLHATPGTVIDVVQVIENESYDPTSFNNDMAILILASPIRLGPNAKIIPLATQEPREGALTTVTGWGVTTEGGAISEILQQLTVPIISRERCNRFYQGRISEQMLCAGLEAGGVDACQGDSGGPLAYQNTLLGVVSWGVGCARPQRPGIYASVPHMYNWIQSRLP